MSVYLDDLADGTYVAILAGASTSISVIYGRPSR
jgi:hypothetical protein